MAAYYVIGNLPKNVLYLGYYVVAVVRSYDEFAIVQCQPPDEDSELIEVTPNAVRFSRNTLSALLRCSDVIKSACMSPEYFESNLGDLSISIEQDKGVSLEDGDGKVALDCDQWFTFVDGVVWMIAESYRLKYPGSPSEDYYDVFYRYVLIDLVDLVERRNNDRHGMLLENLCNLRMEEYAAKTKNKMKLDNKTEKDIIETINFHKLLRDLKLSIMTGWIDPA